MMVDTNIYMDFQNSIAMASGRQRRLSDTIQSAKQIDDGNDDPKLRGACQEMESLFINHLLKEMRATVDKSGFISGGYAEEIFTSMLDAELSKEAACRGGIGLADILYNQLKNQMNNDR